VQSEECADNPYRCIAPQKSTGYKFYVDALLVPGTATVCRYHYLLVY